jgi:DNA-binding LacI/PurR family transcriptional regulator
VSTLESASRGAVMVDVARLAGVSQKTVSRVVNNAPHVRPDVREKVNRAIEELGYRPNVAARALARQRTHIIGVLAAGAPLLGPARRLFSLEHAARAHGYALAVTSLPDLSPANVADGIRDLLARGVEGLVIEVPTHLVEVDALQLGGLPIVTSAGRIAGIDNQTVIDVDQAGVCRELTEYLLSLGHETVWHIAGPADWDASEKRQDGWRSALEAAGRRVPPVLVGDWSARSGYQQGRQLATLAEVTAVFAANDHMAMGVLRAFAEAGRRIPADVSVAGFDDVPESEFQMVPLTTVAIDAEDTAERILSELVHMIEIGRPTTDSVDMEARLVLRRSTGRRAGH